MLVSCMIQSHPTTGLLSIKDTKEIMDLTWKYRAQWRFIGTGLGMDEGTLDAISKDERKVGDCLREMINIWLRNTHPTPTLSALKAVLNSECVSGIMFTSTTDHSKV